LHQRSLTLTDLNPAALPLTALLFVFCLFYPFAVDAKSVENPAANYEPYHYKNLAA
jgi:hypothetical protein